MNTFKRKALSCAILGGLGAVAGTAHAVYEDPNGLGQALIFPYYTVQQASGNSYNTYMSVVNTTTRAKALKVRFREGKNSREVLDFNLYLSPNDVWTAAIVPADNTATSGGRLVTADQSCTAPRIVTAGATTGSVDFRNFAFVGGAADGAGTGLDRTREGYIEVVEMANLTGAAAAAVTHAQPAGVPANCAFVQPANGFTAATNAAFLQPPSGGVTGSYTLINVNNGADMGGNPTVLANFSLGTIFTDVGNEQTNLSSANPPVAVTVSSQNGASGQGAVVSTATYASGADAVSATIMHSQVINEYVLDAATKSATDWVLTFPTKRFYVTTAAALPPFTNNFAGAAGACESIGFVFFNREESGAAAAADQFSPLQPGQTVAMCWESQVMSILNVAGGSTSSVFGSVNNLNVTVNSNFQNGWANLSFTGANAATVGLSSVAGTGTVANVNTGAPILTAQTVNYRGLPVIGFMARTLSNGTLTCGTASCQGNYGSLFDHKFVVQTTPTP